jgi:hypothetical protein
MPRSGGRCVPMLLARFDYSFHDLQITDLLILIFK